MLFYFVGGGLLLYCVILFVGGFYVTYVPPWAYWIRYLSFVQYSYYAILTVDFTNSDIL